MSRTEAKYYYCGSGGTAGVYQAHVIAPSSQGLGWRRVADARRTWRHYFMSNRGPMPPIANGLIGDYNTHGWGLGGVGLVWVTTAGCLQLFRSDLLVRAPG